MKRLHLEQRTDEWLQWRQSGLGGSDAAAVVGLSPWRSAAQLWREKTSRRQREEASASRQGAMARGRRLEPVVERLYEEFMGIELEQLCCVHDSHDFLKASLDGWNEERQLVCEIKAPNRDDHRLALVGRVPEKYGPQCDHLLLVTGGRKCHYVSYSDYFPAGEQFVVVPWPRDENRLDELLAAELEFWDHVRRGEPLPGCSDELAMAL